MPKAEGKIFKFSPESEIKTSFLEKFPYQGNPQFIRYETNEFTAVCPFSGLPDIAKVIIEYIPNKFIIELKSLKYYFVSFRNIGIYQEAVTNKITNDIYNLIKPKYLKVTTIYNTRGGIDSTCFIEKGKK